MKRLPNRVYSKEYKQQILKEYKASKKGPNEFTVEKNMPMQVR